MFYREEHSYLRNVVSCSFVFFPLIVNNLVEIADRGSISKKKHLQQPNIYI